MKIAYLRGYAIFFAKYIFYLKSILYLCSVIKKGDLKWIKIMKNG